MRRLKKNGNKISTDPMGMMENFAAKAKFVPDGGEFKSEIELYVQFKFNFIHSIM